MFQEGAHTAAYSAQASEYARLIDPSLRPLAERLVQLAQVRRSDRVLDVACGTGNVARAAARAGAEIWAIDLSSGMVRTAQEVSPPGIRFVVAPAERLPFGADEFDVVTCGLGLTHFADMTLALAEVRRVLRRGGRFAAAVWAERSHTQRTGSPWRYSGATRNRRRACPTPRTRTRGIIRTKAFPSSNGRALHGWRRPPNGSQARMPMESMRWHGRSPGRASGRWPGPSLPRAAASSAGRRSRRSVRQAICPGSSPSSSTGRRTDSRAAQYLNDPIVLDAVNDVESLAGNLSVKIWQKTTILDTVTLRGQQ